MIRRFCRVLAERGVRRVSSHFGIRSGGRLAIARADDATVPVLPKLKTSSRIWTYVRDERPKTSP
jgi:hypothetical protein